MQDAKSCTSKELPRYLEMQLLPQPCNVQSPCAYTVTCTHCPWIGGTGGPKCPKCPVSGTCPLCNLLQHSVPSGSWDQPGSVAKYTYVDIACYTAWYIAWYMMIFDDTWWIHYDTLWYMMIHVIYKYIIYKHCTSLMYIYIYVPIHPSVRPSVHPWIIHPSIHPPIYIFMN